MYNLTTAIREILRPDHILQHYEILHLSTDGFTLEQGVWVRRTYLMPKVYETVFETPRREVVKELCSPE